MIKSKSYATALLSKQLKELSESQFSVGLIDDDMFKWNVCFEGP